MVVIFLIFQFWWFFGFQRAFRPLHSNFQTFKCTQHSSKEHIVWCRPNFFESFILKHFNHLQCTRVHAEHSNISPFAYRTRVLIAFRCDCFSLRDANRERTDSLIKIARTKRRKVFNATLETIWWYNLKFTRSCVLLLGVLVLHKLLVI